MVEDDNDDVDDDDDDDDDDEEQLSWFLLSLATSRATPYSGM